MLGSPNPADEILGHGRAEPPANEDVDGAVGAALSKIHRRLAGGVAAADDDDIVLVVDDGFDARAGVVNSLSLKSPGAGGVELPPANAGRDEDRVAARDVAAVQVERVEAVDGRRADAIDVHGGDHLAPNLSICRTLRDASSAPDRPLGKPMKFSIFDDAEA